MNSGEALVKTLIAHGVELGFTVPGESFLTTLDAIRQRQNSFRLITTRHEGGAAFAAEAYGKLTGKPAAVFVSRGPGVTNAAIGVHTAKQDSTPLLLFMGQVRSSSKGRESFQEIDPHTTFASMTKAVIEPATAEDVATSTALAVHIATSGRPGPVIVVIPKDVIEAEIGDLVVPARPATVVAKTDPRDITAAVRLIEESERPLLIVGEMVSYEDATAELIALAEATGAPVMTAYRRQDVFPNEHPAYAGHLEINRVAYQREALDAMDLVIAAGSRLDGITMEDYTLFRDEQRLIHLYPDAEVLGRYRSDVAIAAPVMQSFAALAKALPPPPAERLAWRDGLHQGYLAFSSPGTVSVQGEVDLAAVVADVIARVPEEAMILTDGGSFARWIHRYYRFNRPHTQVGPISGAMGYAVPGAIGSHLARPDAPVIAFAGDGSFMMSGQELATAAQHQLPIKVIVCDNNAHGSILMGQVNYFGEDAVFNTRLKSPDFAALARAYGIAGWTVTRTAEFAPAFEAAMSEAGPALLHLVTDERDIVPYGAGKEAV